MELPCSGCEREVPAGTRFCTECGTPVRARGRNRETSGQPGTAEGKEQGSSLAEVNAGWWVSGALLLVLLAVLGVQVLSGGPDAPGGTASVGPGTPGAPGSPGALGPAPNVDLSTMTPREAADALFNRVMGAASEGDSIQVLNFLPMALDAYELARPLDEDGLFHISLLERVGGNYSAALGAALEGLEGNPDHLLNLSSAAEAAVELGDVEGAREYYSRMLDVWDEEIEADRPEYAEHSPLLPLIRADAEEFLEQDGG